MERRMKNSLSLALLSLLICARAQAQEDGDIAQRPVEVAQALVCDTQMQVERFVAHYKGDQAAAIQAVNREEGDPTACNVVSAAFVRGPQIGTASHGNMAFRIVRILILAVEGSDGLQVVKPVPYFAAFGVPEYRV
jgi:hypothetical protein